MTNHWSIHFLSSLLFPSVLSLRMPINRDSQRIIALYSFENTNMDTTSFNLLADEYIRAAPDTQLSSSQTLLLTTLLSEEDQYDYNQLLKTSLPDDILHTLYQVRFYFILISLSYLSPHFHFS